MFSPMDPIIFLLLLTSFFTCPLPLLARSTKPAARITVVGVVYCDSCSSNAFSRHSYFMPGVDVQIQCKFKANTPEATEQMNFSVNRTTNKYGVYKLDIPSVGVNCINGLALVSMCHASLLRSSSSACSVPALRTTSDEISIKSEQDNLCIYSLNAMSYRPSKKNTTLCANQKEELASSFNSSKSLFPFYPPYKYPLPPLSSLPFPPLLPSPSVPFPLPPFPLQSPPSLPFPFPPLPPFPPTPSLFQPPPPPAFSLTDPRTWFPNNPLYSPPPPPAFSLTDPRTWIPPIPPSPPSRIQDKNP